MGEREMWRRQERKREKGKGRERKGDMYGGRKEGKAAVQPEGRAWGVLTLPLSDEGRK